MHVLKHQLIANRSNIRKVKKRKKNEDQSIQTRKVAKIKIRSLLERELNIKQKYIAPVSNFLKQIIAVP